MSTYSSSLRIELPSDGTQAGTWGDTTNSNLAYILDTSVAGYQTVSVTAASQALTYTNGPTSTAASNQAVYAMLRFTTTTGAAFAVYAPPASKAYIIWNDSGQSMTLRVSDVIGSTTAISGNVALTIANGNKVLVWSDAVSFYDIKANNVTGTVAIANGGTGQTSANAAFNALAPVQTSNANKYLQTDGTNTSWDAVSLSTADITGTLPIANGGTGQTSANAALNALLPSQGSNANKYLQTDGTNSSWDAISLSTADITGTLAVANGGTGVTSSTGTGAVVLSASPTFTGAPLAPTAAVGTDTTQIATTAFVRDIIPTGVITMWYGSIASIPSGWFLCDGANSTPDLRDRFIVGAGSTYGVAATGGSANATLVSHNHTASSSSSFSGSALGTHSHSISDPGHTHSQGAYGSIGSGIPGTTVIYGSGTAITSAVTGVSVVAASAGTPAGSVSTSTSISTEGSSATNANLPPYYALAYIMKA
jgi:hypothetical protein